MQYRRRVRFYSAQAGGALRTYENAEKEKRYVTEVVAEKVTFLSSRRGE